MTAQSAIATAVRRLASTKSPSKIILFGSRATGKASKDSDIDFVVIEPRVSSKITEIARLRDAVGHVGLGVDILVYSEQEVAEWGEVPGTALYDALHEGKVLYEKYH